MSNNKLKKNKKKFTYEMDYQIISVIQYIHHHDQNRDGFSVSQSNIISKGQWERRLQTDIHTAKQALCEALSLDKSTNNNLPDELKPSHASSTYALSTENISGSLKKWMKNSPKSSQTSSESTTQNSFNNP
uniref:Putative MYB1 protein n=1 Tax=Davidia involucrata TaxID=16924 RepID=A0A5B6YI38_DAVIN